MLFTLALVLLPFCLCTPTSSSSSPPPSQCDATKQFYQNMACCGSKDAELVCNSAKHVDLGTLTSKLDTLSATRANFMGTAASQFVDSNTQPCPSNVLEALFQIYLKRMPTDDEVRRANSSYGYVRISEDVANAFMAKNYPSIVDGKALAGKVFAIIGGSSGWAFTASILLVKYGAKAVYSCARTAAVFEGSKKAAVGSYDEYEADLAKTDAYFSKHGTVSGYTQKYFPMYSGIMGVDPAVFDKIHFSECDVRIASSMTSFFEGVKEKAAGQLDAVFFVASTYGSVNGVPRGTVIEQVSTVGPQSWTAPVSRSDQEVIASAPDRSAPQIDESPYLTMTWGEKNAIDALISSYGLERAKRTRFVFTGSFTSTSAGENYIAHATSPLWSEYVGSKKITMMRYISFPSSGFDVAIIMPGGALTPLNGPVLGQFLHNSSAYSPFVSRMPTVLPGGKGYDFVESGRMYQKVFGSVEGWNNGMPFPEVTTATMVPIVAASSAQGLGVRQLYLTNLLATGFERTYDVEQPGGVGATEAWTRKIGTCAVLDAGATADVEATMQAEFNIFGPGPLCLHHEGGPSC